MEARIEKARIRVSFPEDMDIEAFTTVQAAIIAAIGSARPVDGHPNEMSCAMSVTNFRKLRDLGCKLGRDDHTRAIVARMQSDLAVYKEESERGRLAKIDETPLTYQFRRPPYAHQVRGFRFLHSMPTPALFGDVGSGKTFIVSTFLDSIAQQGENVATIVVCPINLIKHVWIEEVSNFTGLTAVSLREETDPSVLAVDFDEKGDPKDPIERAKVRAERMKDPAAKKLARKRAVKRHGKVIQQRFDQAADVYVINPEGLRTDVKERRVINLCKRLLAEGKKICLVVDESSRLKTRTSRTFKSLKRIRFYCQRCIIMTGTPSPNGITDLWAQFDLLDGGKTLQPNFIDFRNDVCKETVLKFVSWKDKTGKTHNATTWDPKPGMAMQVHRILEPRTIRFRTQDCIDLPPKRFIVRDVEMNADQVAAYDAMESMLYTEIQGEAVTARVAAGKLMKLREITGGFVISDKGEDLPLGAAAPKMVELDELLDQSIADKLGDQGPPSKALIWANYQWECKTLVKRYAKYGARGLFGGISSKAKDDAIRLFKSSPDCRVLVCHPASVGHGLTLIDANYVFYYSLSHNYEEFYQSHARNARPGQKRTMTYYFLVSPGTIDEEMMDALRTKKDLSDVITDGRLKGEEILGPRRKRRERTRTMEAPAWDADDIPPPAS